MRREKIENELYDQLRRQAARMMREERLEHTLSATALVHEAYLRLGNSFDNPGHFYAAAATAMRRVLVDGARSRRRLKRGGDAVRVALSGIVGPPIADERLIALDDALKALAESDAVAAQVVELHHFGGLSHERVAESLAITVYEARRLWTFARAWLKRTLRESFSTDTTEDDA
jgi:RNA polymerase sigma factor (TIGR02999 family)